MSVTVRHHDHTQGVPCNGSRCGIVYARDGEQVSIYKGSGSSLPSWHIVEALDVMGHPDDPDDLDDEHLCRLVLLAVKHQESPAYGLASVLGGLPRCPQTALLLHCAGCGEYTTRTLAGIWDMADLDPASPVHGGPDPT